jgi:fermentation-respiration switch protein FrsA (DUF1100 family)
MNLVAILPENAIRNGHRKWLFAENPGDFPEVDFREGVAFFSGTSPSALPSASTQPNIMKKSSILLMSNMIALSVFSQDPTGDWNGSLTIQGTQLRIAFHIKQTDSGYVSTMDSPDQKAFGIPVKSTSFIAPDLVMEMPALALNYKGKLGEGPKITGILTQNGQSFPMDLTHDKVEKAVVSRPQEPVKPYPYYEEEVTFTNPNGGHILAGTLTLPKKEGNFPVVVLITGSGPQNRDEELLGHKPFLVLSDHLTRNGIGVLRFDDRGTAKSKGDFKSATTADLSTDAEAAVAYLLTRPEVNKKQIGLIGHSEGGLIAPIVAARNKNVSYIVLMAGTGIPGDELLLKQEELITRATGSSEEEIANMKAMNQQAFTLIRTEKDTAKLRRELTEHVTAALKATPPKDIPAGMSIDAFAQAQINQIMTPWMLYFLRYDPRPTLLKVKCPVLALNGSKDLQVPPKEDLAEIQKALAKGGNKKVTVRELPGLNHLFQECQTGSPDEYAKIEQTISPTALNLISAWILDTLKK